VKKRGPKAGWGPGKVRALESLQCRGDKGIVCGEKWPAPNHHVTQESRGTGEREKTRNEGGMALRLP